MARFRCEGYKMAEKKRKVAAVPRLSSLPVFPELINATESRSFEFFQRCTAPALAWGSDSQFWTSLILEACHLDPAVLHAVLAVSGLHETIVHGSLYQADTQGLSRPHMFALVQYNKAIGHLSSKIDKATSVLEDPFHHVLTCILLICIEYMQANTAEALRYLDQGRHLLCYLASSGRLTQAQRDVTCNVIVPMYHRLELACSCFGSIPPAIPTAFNIFRESPAVFTSIAIARNTFYAITDDAVRWRNLCTTVRDSSAANEYISDWMKEQHSLLARFSRWNTAFNIFLATQASISPTEPSTLLLQIHYYVLTVWVATAINPSEAEFDKHTEAFGKMLPLIRTYLQAKDSEMQMATTASIMPKGDAVTTTDQPRKTPSNPDSKDVRPGADEILGEVGRQHTFSFEFEVIPAISMIACKCRHPHIRQAAIRLLLQHEHRQENLYHARLMGMVASCIMEYEEAAVAAPVGTGPENASSNDTPSPPYGLRDEHRVSQLIMEKGEGLDKIWLTLFTRSPESGIHAPVRKQLITLK